MKTAVTTAVVAVYHRDDQTLTIHERDNDGQPGDVLTGVTVSPAGARHGADLDDDLFRAGYLRTDRWTRTAGGELLAPVEVQA